MMIHVEGYFLYYQGIFETSAFSVLEVLEQWFAAEVR
jgi:hypothetical protein